jgi:hypothetical protein
MLSTDLRQRYNEERRRLFAATAEIAFVCECADDRCTASVILTPDAYDDVRRSPPHLLLHEAHAQPRRAS